MRVVVFGFCALVLALSAAPAHATEIAVFHFKFESFKTSAQDGAPEALIVDHAVNEIKKRGLLTVTLYTSCDTAETNCKDISRVRHNVVAIALSERIGHGKLKFESQYLGTSEPAIDKGPNVQEPLNRMVKVVAPDLKSATRSCKRHCRRCCCTLTLASGSKAPVSPNPVAELVGKGRL